MVEVSTDIATPCLSCAVNVNAGSPFSLNLLPFCLLVALSGVNTGSATAVPVALLLDTPLSSLAVKQFAVSILRGLLQDLSMPKGCITCGLFPPHYALLGMGLSRRGHTLYMVTGCPCRYFVCIVLFV